MHDGDRLGVYCTALARRGVRLGMRTIRPGDEAAFGSPLGPLAARRASGAARLLARRLLAQLDFTGAAALDRLDSGAPNWPEGFLGSLAHDDRLAVAVVARTGDLLGLGVDVEPAEALPEDLQGYVLSSAERLACAGDPIAMRAVFVAKEAVYKAINPIDGAALEYGDIEVEASGAAARVVGGRRLALFPYRGRSLIAVAILQR